MSWDVALPRVHVQPGAQPKAVTIILPYFENPQFLQRQIGWWRTFPASLRSHLSAIVVDDCSADHPARLTEDRPFPITLFRILPPKVAWNWLAARNIGAHEAPDSWLVLTDIDHVLPQSTAEALVYGQHDPRRVYAFSRIEHTGERIHPHSASFFMTRTMFWQIGGYDERYSGHYGSDGQYRRRLMARACMAILPDRLIRHEYQGDSSTRAYQRKLPADSAAVKAIADALPAGTTPKVLTFPYHEVAP